MELISVVVPVYNVEKYLGECIESILCQSYSYIEVILVDDGSTDQSADICDMYAKKDERIKVLHKANGGLSSARNAGIAIAKGAYITFVDSDDYIVSDMIESLYQILKREKAEISVCSFSSKEENLDEGEKWDSEVFTKYDAIKEILIERKMTTSAWGKLYEIALFDKVEFPIGKVYEDYGTIYKLFDLSNKVVLLKCNKYFYRYNPESITKVGFNFKRMDYFDISREVEEYMQNKYPDLLKNAINRRTRYAISFYKEISQSNYNNQQIIDYLAGIIRGSICKYVFSGYKLTSKMYGIFISLFQEFALTIFKQK